MILVLDNYDSFTYNLVHYIGESGQEVLVVRNDEITIEQINDLNPEKIVISPGPCTPKEAGISIELIKNATVPLLGVCLGHQAIGAAFGGNIIKAPEIFHGKLSEVEHNNENIFKGIDSPYSVVRYHSLIIEKDSLPDELKITGVLKDNPEIIMAIEHKEKPIYGVQFHPESIETDFGMKLIENFLAL
ncbi:aminodeoxychorismate/anthranilate synthase component II [Gammaproteobacteria bacterium]|jgi:anthranilate synthase/aminodeoxychorismate synthase-like glutamine amidotransferase|nr:aminodeoxychorismate/anthranilate synthase component II [Gammaproteobacteria bacterium]MDA7857282.1 aminodeoxychorismate/anthranilate synthase component II [Gammaproteobacteria bacterium]MDA8854108.1 aminodeoxychorismate/anthranilate synthase component II [Gammaproteobacteria bacterium]MDA8916184.1 aminodeoxychorismate/anthranilate synthase component II [Gammaproteobacteria bacterium]MDA9353388.1 aminodeoxychorismate/anthranilate synthase component II [Gammaproteobacteria bacterium]|tara:strand:+ start:252 stop:815 length:564 start_codon:yes stop_codon:yes gene_type:complete